MMRFFCSALGLILEQAPTARVPGRSVAATVCATQKVFGISLVSTFGSLSVTSTLSSMRTPPS